MEKFELKMSKVALKIFYIRKKSVLTSQTFLYRKLDMLKYLKKF